MRYIELIPVRSAMLDDPAHYRSNSYCSNALGKQNQRVRPHPVFLTLSRRRVENKNVYRALFRASLDHAAIDDNRLALNQSQPVGRIAFAARIEQMTEQRRQAQLRGQPRKDTAASESSHDQQCLLAA